MLAPPSERACAAAVRPGTMRAAVVRDRLVEALPYDPAGATLLSPDAMATRREALGDAGRAKRRAVANQVIKYVRKSLTTAEGVAVAMYDVSDGDPFRFAPFVYQGKGQAGAWDFTAEPLEFNWRDVVSQLDDADFRRASEAGGVQRVHIAPVAVGGRPWMEGGANFAICMTMANGEVATCRWNSKGRAESGTGVTWSAGGVALDLPGPDAVAQARGQR